MKKLLIGVSVLALAFVGIYIGRNTSTAPSVSPTSPNSAPADIKASVTAARDSLSPQQMGSGARHSTQPHDSTRHIAMTPEPKPVSQLFSGAVILTSALANAGNATPAAALETLLWSKIHGNETVHAELLRLSDLRSWELAKTPTGHQQTSEIRGRYVQQAVQQASDIGAVQVIESRSIGAENALVRVKQFHANGEASVDIVLMRLTPEGWIRDIGWMDPSSAAGLPK